MTVDSVSLFESMNSTPGRFEPGPRVSARRSAYYTASSCLTITIPIRGLDDRHGFSTFQAETTLSLCRQSLLAAGAPTDRAIGGNPPKGGVCVSTVSTVGGCDGDLPDRAR
jgi:hypothetical protein